MYFEWVFQKYKSFVKAPPKLIVTDACASFNKAIRNEFRGSLHFICNWHLKQNLKNTRDSKLALQITYKLEREKQQDKKIESEDDHIIIYP